jgi:hypothetical protein
MSIFGNIWNKITGHEAAKPIQPQAPAQPAAVPATPTPAAATDSAPVPQASIDVGAVLEAMAAAKDDHGGNYQTSIVDLLKLLDLDPDLTARKTLAEELGVHAGEPGSAEQNIALHRAVVDKLAENGGIVPDSLRS